MPDPSLCGTRAPDPPAREPAGPEWTALAAGTVAGLLALGGLLGWLWTLPHAEGHPASRGAAAICGSSATRSKSTYRTGARP